MPRGYDRPLYIQPFDHRGSFQTKMFGWQSPLSDAQTAEIAAAKRVVYDGFLAALAGGVPKEKAGILVDEQFGAAILRDAASRNIVTACPAEKSGQHEFDFEYGEDFARHIEAFDPTFCKVLVRYNPEGDGALNKRQAARLKRLSEFLAARGRGRFMFELLVPAEKMQLDRLAGDKRVYDLELRPRLMVEAIRELQDRGVEPDLWKLEGLDRREDCERVVAAAALAGVTLSAVSFSVAARTTAKFVNGSRSRRLCRASSALRSAALFSGIRWLPGGANKRRASRLLPRSPGAIVSSWICSRGRTQACLQALRRAFNLNVVPL
jgi:myo-inositol catabolism protein IolC